MRIENIKINDKFRGMKQAFSTFDEEMESEQ